MGLYNQSSLKSQWIFPLLKEYPGDYQNTIGNPIISAIFSSFVILNQTTAPLCAPTAKTITDKAAVSSANILVK